MVTRDRRYEVRVAGLVPMAVLAGLDEVEVATQELRTVLSGAFADQAALHGFLHRLRSLGLEVVEVRQPAAPPDGMPDEAPGGGTVDLTPRG